ncbi:MAG: Asp-tRNA(Asn)/Glu-tRNA(Gln) amidotransferase subunit GatA [Patescibacteria group bacterium]|nr:Asp-tRNA(Asn)/Glu-tRNA(Gln) amidotransferase subunit GatA [Patescibacteria group bacterium]
MIKELHNKLINKEISAVELTTEYLARAKKSDLNAFITITESEALEQAAVVDEAIERGEEIPLLAGIPASIKDLLMTEGVRTTAASKILENYIAPYDATVVKKLKENGLVMIGKNNCDEFAMGSSTENSAFGPTKNPYDKTRVAGGTSGGSAAAVASDLSIYSIGTDTGGSVRQPAAFCGVVGMKPTYGAVSRFGLIADASSLDQVGVIAKSVEDAEIVFNAIKGKDERDATSTLKHENIKTLKQNNGLRGIKIGIPKEYFSEGIDQEVGEAIADFIKRAKDLGAEIVEISLPHMEYALTVYYIIQPAEASANLARYDGVRYGKLTINNKQSTNNQLIDIYKKTRAEFLGPEVKRRIMLGTYALSAGYYDAYYKKAQQVRTLIREDFKKAFEEVNLIFAPTAPHPAWKIGEKIDDPLAMYLEDIFTVPVNIAGLPALSVPAGITKAGLPIGAQIIGGWGKEEEIFQAGKTLEL